MPRPDPKALKYRHNAIQLLTLLLIVSAGVLVYSSTFAMKETRYAARGRTAVANVTKVEPAPSAGPTAMKITYQFTDADGATHTDTGIFPHGTLFAVQRHFDINYVPGAADSSIPAFNRRTWAVPVLLTSLLLTLIAAIFLARIVRQEVKTLPEPATRRRETFRIQRRTA